MHTHTHKQHDMLVSSVDWSAQTNQIVTCSHDRNAFVWTYDKKANKWNSKMVILRIDRAANHVKWSPNGKKFAVGSSSKKVPVCHYEEEQDWWIAEMVKKHKSSILALDWHPNSQLIATGACDFRCRIFCAYNDKVDDEQNNGPFDGKLEEDPEFGDLICEFSSKGWIESVSWSESGNHLAFASHDATLTVVDFSGEEVTQQVIKMDKLPLRDIKFVGDDKILGVGYNFVPYLFESDGEEFTMTGSIDKQKKKKEVKKASAHSFWQNKTKLGTAKAEAKLKSKHDNTITCLCEKKKGVYTTTGLDGRVFEWTV